MNFKDVSQNHWGISGISWVVRNNIMSGRTPSSFAPNESITRAEFANALMRYHIHMIDTMQNLQERIKQLTIQSKNAVVVISAGRSLGSGSLISKDGYIITNNHVISDEDGEISEDITVKVIVKQSSTSLEGTKDYKARVIARDTFEDLALLKIEPNTGISYFKVADQAAVEGSFVLAIGHPFGFHYTTSLGIISQDMQLVGFSGMVQFDAQISAGNSGGALISVESGELIGIPTRKAEQMSGRIGDGLGFAIPVQKIRAFLKAQKVEV